MAWLPQRDRPHRRPVDRHPTLHRRLHCLAACMSALERKKEGFNLGSVIYSFPFSSPLIYARRDRVEDVFGFLTRTSAQSSSGPASPLLLATRQDKERVPLRDHLYIQPKPAHLIEPAGHGPRLCRLHLHKRFNVSPLPRD